jgi:cell division protein FtsZ
VRGITDLMVMPGLINLDFADVRSVMQEMGKAMMGTGEASGDNRALEAAQKAIANPLLDGVSMQGAKGVIISITGGDDMRLLEVDEAANHIRDLVDPDANIIWGSAFNPDLEGRIRVSVVATGIEAVARPAAAAPAETNRFSFGGGRREETQSFRPTEAQQPAAPAAEPEPEVASDAATEEEPLDLGTAADMVPETADAADEELVLGAEAIVAQPPKTFSDDAYGAPQPQPAETNRWRIAPGSEADATGAKPAPRVKLGGTLFERMSAARTAQREERDGSGDGAVDIPTFLHKQGNQ